MKQLQELHIQTRVTSLLQKSISNQHIHHGYLFYGEKGTGKLATALSFAYHLTCATDTEHPCGTCPSCVKNQKGGHPDVHLYFPTNIKNGAADPKTVDEGLAHYKTNPFASFKVTGNKSHFVETIRQIKSESKFPPHEAKRKVYIIHEIEYMNDASANAFLKLLEEPPENTIIIMTTTHLDGILPTIQSRCQKLFFSHLTETQIEQILSSYTTNYSPLAIKLAYGNCAKAFEYAQEDFTELRQRVTNFLRYSVMNKPVEITEIIEQLTKRKNKDLITDFLNLLLFWFQDASHIKQSSDLNHIINIDLQAELAKFTAHYGERDFLKLIDCIEETKEAIYANVHTSIALSHMAIRINKLLIN